MEESKEIHNYVFLPFYSKECSIRVLRVDLLLGISEHDPLINLLVGECLPNHMIKQFTYIYKRFGENG